MEYWLSVDIEDIDVHRVIKVQIVGKLELESARGFTVLLAVVTELSQLLDHALLDLVT